MAKKYNFGNPFKKGNIDHIWIRIANPKNYPLFPDEAPGKAVIWFRNGNIEGQRTIRAKTPVKLFKDIRAFIDAT